MFIKDVFKNRQFCKKKSWFAAYTAPYKKQTNNKIDVIPRTESF